MWRFFNHLTLRDWRFVYRLEFSSAALHVSNLFCVSYIMATAQKRHFAFLFKKQRPRGCRRPGNQRLEVLMLEIRKPWSLRI